MPHFLLFADDIALNGRNEKETQQLLDIIGKWCTDYGMSPGFAKCNYISEKNINLKLLDNLLDRTDSGRNKAFPIISVGGGSPHTIRLSIAALVCIFPLSSFLENIYC